MGKGIRRKHARTHISVSSHSHWVCARGQVSLPLPPLWKDLSPRGLSCSVGQRGKRLCKSAKRGAGLGMHEANPAHTKPHTCMGVCAHTPAACMNLADSSLRQPALYEPVRISIKRSNRVVKESSFEHVLGRGSSSHDHTLYKYSLCVLQLLVLPI